MLSGNRPCRFSRHKPRLGHFTRGSDVFAFDDIQQHFRSGLDHVVDRLMDGGQRGYDDGRYIDIIITDDRDVSGTENPLRLNIRIIRNAFMSFEAKIAVGGSFKAKRSSISAQYPPSSMTLSGKRRECLPAIYRARGRNWRSPPSGDAPVVSDPRWRSDAHMTELEEIVRSNLCAIGVVEIDHGDIIALNSRSISTSGIPSIECQ